ncbi:restriction endonuclease [Turicimonas sp. TL08]
MEFQFKIQAYQTDAVESTVAVFDGQPLDVSSKYPRELGRLDPAELNYENDFGYRNNDIILSDEELLSNINNIQTKNLIPRSKTLSTKPGRLNLDIEMETGTGKTYVYIKTMFELNKKYGWSKFIIVVPSIAIREGVLKSFAMLESHFFASYSKKARYFKYDSKNLHQLDEFSQTNEISVMIVNTQAFAASLKEDGRVKESKIIYEKRDEFGSRRPIDVIAANRPIIIRDEPQKMEGDKTQSALPRFKPLFILNYSATHKTKHNCVYALDAYDAYKEKLVKRIFVKGFEVKNLIGTNSYMYLDSFILSPTKPPIARIEIECKRADGTIRKELKKFSVGDSLKAASGELGEYEGYVITEINPRGKGCVMFQNGQVLYNREVKGDITEEAIQKNQIRHTIESHLEKECELFHKGIKCLSLFFLDEVSNYRQYDESGQAVKGKFQKFFEEEYTRLVEESKSLFDPEYTAFLNRFDVEKIHNGYFSIDKKGKLINSPTKSKTDISEDESAYDLILKNKERLLSLNEPTRFIFSHSALREGWDNPNIFQICTLRHSNSSTAKRQEIGRGMRLCVDKFGVRQDKDLLGEDVHSINRLTVITNESYTDFVKALQNETKEVLRDRPLIITEKLFDGKFIQTNNGEKYQLTHDDAISIVYYMLINGYKDKKGYITSKFNDERDKGRLAPLDSRLETFSSGIFQLISTIANQGDINKMIAEEHPKVTSNKLTQNFYNPRFQTFWGELSKRYLYRVDYNSQDLINNVINNLKKNLFVSQLKYVMTTGEQNSQEVNEFDKRKTTTRILNASASSTVKYDLVGDISKNCNLTRKSVVEILKGMGEQILLFRQNPEEFIRNVCNAIHDEKAAMFVEHIRYEPSKQERYEATIFTPERSLDINKVITSSKHISEHVSFDSDVEKTFAKDLDEATEVQIFAKLPRKLKIPTPVGDYSPDWAIVFKEECGIEHVFFVAETKGTMNSMELRGVEEKKINCAKQLFGSLFSPNVQYTVVDSYQKLMEVIDKEPTLPSTQKTD